MSDAELSGRQLIFPDLVEADLSRDLMQVGTRVREFASRYQGKLDGLGSEEFATMLRECEEIVTPLQRATAFAEARLAANSEDLDAMALLDHCETLWREVAEHGYFVEGEIAELSPATVSSLLASPDLATHAPHLRKIRAAAGEQPPAAVATALATLDPTAGWERLARQLLARITVRDSGQQLSLGAALPMLYEPSRERRRSVTDAITAALTPEVELRATALCALAQTRVGRGLVCGSADWLHPEYVANQVSAPEVSALLTAMRDQRTLVHRYYQAKSEILGQPLTDADRYAPVGTPPTVTWAEAVEIVRASFVRLGGQTAAAALDLLDRGAVDALPRHGKRRGALTFSLPGGDAWVLMNFTGRARDVLTLAHELGHAVHTRLSGHHGPFNAAVPTVLAETIGLFTELFTAEFYADLAGGADARTAVLFRGVEDQLVAAFRQLALHDFEAQLHAAAGSGETPDVTTLAGLWMRGQEELYGPAVALGTGYRYWWSYIDNIFLQPGSRFAYVYGQLAAAALLGRYHDDPAGFGHRFEELLRSGATKPPAVLLAELGIRVNEPDGWQIGLAALHDQVDRICGESSKSVSGTSS